MLYLRFLSIIHFPSFFLHLYLYVLCLSTFLPTFRSFSLSSIFRLIPKYILFSIISTSPSCSSRPAPPGTSWWPASP